MGGGRLSSGFRFQSFGFSVRCRANSAHIRQSRPDYGLGLQVSFFKLPPPSRGSGRAELFVAEVEPNDVLENYLPRALTTRLRRKRSKKKSFDSRRNRSPQTVMSKVSLARPKGCTRHVRELLQFYKSKWLRSTYLLWLRSSPTTYWKCPYTSRGTAVKPCARGWGRSQIASGRLMSVVSLQTCGSVHLARGYARSDILAPPHRHA